METKWLDPRDGNFTMHGFPWISIESVYRRLPLNGSEKLPESVDNLANSTAGGQLLFCTNSPYVLIRVKLASGSNMYHMPATGQCGFDLYMGEGRGARYHRTACFERDDVEYECPLFESETSVNRSFIINFPLYQGVTESAIGISKYASVDPLPIRFPHGKIVVYGTSITQGGCASRPGLAYTNILSRRLEREVVNLGFSGSGRGEAEVIRTMASIDEVDLFILDYEGNAGFDGLTATLSDAISILREAHADIPILVVSRIRYARDLVDESTPSIRIRGRDFQRDMVKSFNDHGDTNVYFLDGADLLGDDFDECTVDGVHPGDLGFMRMANAMTPVVENLLG